MNYHASTPSEGKINVLRAAASKAADLTNAMTVLVASASGGIKWEFGPVGLAIPHINHKPQRTLKHDIQKC